MVSSYNTLSFLRSASWENVKLLKYCFHFDGKDKVKMIHNIHSFMLFTIRYKLQTIMLMLIHKRPIGEYIVF